MTWLQNLSIRARLGAALAFVVLMMVGLGAVAMSELNTLAELTNELYDHPLRVSNAAMRASLGVAKMDLHMEDITSPAPKYTEQETIAALRDEERVVYENLDIVRSQILGQEGQRLEREARALFDAWKPIRQETLHHIAIGDHEGAAATRAQKAEPHIEHLERELMGLNQYARNRADGFMAEALRVQARARATTIGMVFAAALLSAALLLFILRSVVASMSSLQTTMSEITTTGTFAQAPVTGHHEITEMTRNFNALIGALQKQFWLRDGLNALHVELSGSSSYEDVVGKSITFVSRYVDACAGALYAPDREMAQCELRASYAFVEREQLSSAFRMGHGIVGQVAVEKRSILLKNILRSAAEGQSGTVREPARCIYALPLIYEDDLQGVLEVASFVDIEGTHREFLDAAGRVIATAMYTFAQSTKIKELLAIEQASNELLAEKSRELNTANQQLLATNEELQSQAHELEAQAEELRSQASELETQQAQLQESDRLKSEFLSNMSHELRTPLNSVLALSQLMISRGVGKDPAQEQEYLRVIERNGRRLLALINDILDLSKIESGRTEVSSTDFNPCELAQSVIETTEPMARVKGLALTLEAKAPVTMRSDEEKIRQIVLNLASNAVKFTDEGTVALVVEEHAGWIRFLVRDTGIGISSKDLRYVFDEFRQVDGSTTRRHEGTGLGLAICKKLAALIGGRVDVESELGVGSTFTLSVPTGRSKESPAYAPQATSNRKSAAPAPDGRTVLVIDDEAQARQTLKAHLEQGGYHVLLASSGAEGLELARRYRPSAITLDLVMPGMDGWEVITRLKAVPETADIPVVIASVSHEHATGEALGAAGYVTKPVDPEVLLSEIAKLARKRVRRILVIDDDAVARKEVARALGERGYSVETASGGAEGLALARQGRPDAVVLDLMMPEVDGFKVLEELRGEHATATVPVVVLTAKDLTAGERERLHRTAQRVLEKSQPDRAAVLARLDRALERAIAGAEQQLGKPWILVVEDNPTATLQIRSALEDAGCAVEIASNGQEAIERLAAGTPRALVLDLMMPGIDGFQLLEKIRSMPRTAALPVLVVTAMDLTLADRARLRQQGVEEISQKGSMHRDELVAKVSRMMGTEIEDVVEQPVVEPSVSRATRELGATVLLVEDNPDNQFTLSAILRDLGFAHEIAADGLAAVEMTRSLRPALVLMDIQLPGLSGLDATRRIKADPELRDVPVVALTARAMKGDRENILAAGCDGYLAKPVDRDSLASTIRKWIV